MPDEEYKIKDIIEIEHFGESELVEKLRHVTMLKDEKTKPYEKAYISLEILAISELFPAQRYVWKPELYKVRSLKWQLERHGIDLFKLDGFVRMHFQEEPKVIDLLPPIVEEVIERNGHVVRIINDGMHRIYLAYLEWVIPQVVFIRGVPKSLPYYAFPIPDNDWGKIDVRDDIPEEFIKKWHRIEQNKKLYRNFNSSFENVGGPRGNPIKSLS